MVSLSGEASAASTGSLLRLETAVTRDGSPLDLMRLSHRFTANPGRVEWTGQAYVFRGLQPGRADITLEVIADDGRYGRATASLVVR